MSFFLRVPRSTIARYRPSAARLAAPFSISTTRGTTGSDYGGGQEAPEGQKPHQQGKNPSEHLEHPGPEPPNVGQKGSSQGSSNGSSTPQAKIHTEDSNSSPSAGQAQAHNDEFDARHDRSSQGKDESVDKKYWKGDAGPKGN